MSTHSLPSSCVISVIHVQELTAKSQTMVCCGAKPIFCVDTSGFDGGEATKTTMSKRPLFLSLLGGDTGFLMFSAKVGPEPEQIM